MSSDFKIIERIEHHKSEPFKNLAVTQICTCMETTISPESCPFLAQLQATISPQMRQSILTNFASGYCVHPYL